MRVINEAPDPRGRKVKKTKRQQLAGMHRVLFRNFQAPDKTEWAYTEVSVATIPDLDKHAESQNLVGKDNCRRNLEAADKSMRSWNSQWYGGAKSMDHMRQILKEGYPEGAKRATELAKILQNHMEAENIKPQDIRRVRRFVAMGDELDNDKVRAGRLDQCFETRKREGRALAPVITIVCPYGGVGTVTHDSLSWQGATSVAIAWALQDAGYSIEILAVNCSRGRYKPDQRIPEARKMSIASKHCGVIRISAPGQSVDVQAVSAIIGHAGTHRSFGFALRTLGLRKLSQGGECGTLTTESEPWGYENAHGREHVFVIPSCHTEERARAACFQIIERINTFADEDTTL